MAKDFKAALTRNRNVAGTEPPRSTQELQPYGESIRQAIEQQASQEPIHQLPVEKLHDNPYQRLSRSEPNDDDIEDLANSIKSVGFYGALLARHKRGTTDQYELAYGHRRKTAAIRAGLTTLPVKIVGLSDQQMLEVMASENFARLDLEPLNQANVIGELATSLNLSAREIGERIGRKRGWVEHRLALYNAPRDIKELVARKPNTIGHVQKLLTVSDPATRGKLIKEIIEHDLTQVELQERIKNLRDPFEAALNLFNLSPAEIAEIEQTPDRPVRPRSASSSTVASSNVPVSPASTIPRVTENSAGINFPSPGVAPSSSGPTAPAVSKTNELVLQKTVTAWRDQLSLVAGQLDRLEHATDEIRSQGLAATPFSDNDKLLVDNLLRRLQKIKSFLDNSSF